VLAHRPAEQHSHDHDDVDEHDPPHDAGDSVGRAEERQCRDPEQQLGEQDRCERPALAGQHPTSHHNKPGGPEAHHHQHEPDSAPLGLDLTQSGDDVDHDERHHRKRLERHEGRQDAHLNIEATTLDLGFVGTGRGLRPAHLAERIRRRKVTPMQRARLIVNPEATSTSPRARDVLAQALASEVDLEVAETKARGHAAELAYDAAAAQYDVVLVLGGDGSVNEVVNGLLANGPSPTTPLLGVVPGGSTNVFARAIGMPDDRVEATGCLLELLRGGHQRSIGLGRADQRWFTFTAGLGLDADVVARVEQKRASGRRSSHSLYVRTALRSMTARDGVPLTLSNLAEPVEDPVGMVLVANTSPWTYLGRLPVDPLPGASFDLGLDLLALHHVGLSRTLRVARQALGRRDRPPRGANVVHRHDQPGFTVRADEPVSFQVDGDYLGMRDEVRFKAASAALRVLA